MNYKPLAIEIDIGTANLVSNATLVLCTNPATAQTLITVSNTSGSNLATMTILANSQIVVEKLPNLRLQATGVKAVPIAYRS
jgi:hypothetical protein